LARERLPSLLAAEWIEALGFECVECFDNVVLFGLCHRMEEWKNEPGVGGEIRLAR
jgi:hypothetical protein